MESGKISLLVFPIDQTKQLAAVWVIERRGLGRVANFAGQI
jgi:hypothetical protein